MLAIGSFVRHATAALAGVALGGAPIPRATPSRATGVTVITGMILDQRGQGVAGASVAILERSGVGTTSRGDGVFTLTVSRAGIRERVTLAVLAAGYVRGTSTVVLNHDTVRVTVRLTAAAASLAAVVVTGTDGGSASDESRNTASKSPSSAPPAAAQGAVKMQRRMGIATLPPTMTRPRAPRSGNTEGYDHIDENPFRSPTVAPLSTFSLDVDRASYSNVRRFIAQGQLPPRDAVRIEELVNYFPYADARPANDGAPLRITTEVSSAPWNANHDLVRIALRARDVDMRRAPASNLVFLIDVSGSMQGPGRLPLVKQSLGLLVNELREQDRVAIVVYAGRAGLVLPSTSGSDKQRILAAIDGLEAGGSTAGGAGIRLAYDVAQENFRRGGINRVVLCTDGDFNVGQSSDGALVELIENRRREGSFLTILGFGMGNYQDAKMEQLAGAGNGNYGYVDDLLEARKLLVKEMGGTLITVAKDVKLQVEFNPSRVQGYRLIGYEDRLLRDEDFANDAKDAGDIGAGHTVTALYEVVRAGTSPDVALPNVAPLRYQTRRTTDAPRDELLHVALRYKAPDGDRSVLVTHRISANRSAPSESMRFASAVAGFGMLLRGSPHAGSLTWRQMLDLARGAQGDDEDGYRADFIQLGETAAVLASRMADRHH